MTFNPENITEAISRANSDSTSNAEIMLSENCSTGKFKTVFISSLKFYSTFFKNEKKSGFRDRIIYSVIASLTELLKNLKLLKLKKII